MYEPAPPSVSYEPRPRSSGPSGAALLLVGVILGGGMPSWELPGAAGGAYKPPAQVDAMEKIIDLARTGSAGALALGSLAVAGCTTSLTPTVTPEAGSASDKRRREVQEGIDATLTRLYAAVPDAR